MANAIVLLQQLDSPAKPKISPWPMLKLTDLTALKSPSSVM
ncbi:hypothetical protein M565_ctg5P1373 [Vibrio cyclitrophicus FF75]|nr:hypothetical protein M565_ctg5P1373 [Vibrio cyclitrophicus FF75]